MQAFLILLLPMLTFCCNAQSEDKLTEKFRLISYSESIRADFVQTRFLKDLGMQVNIQGEMACEKNGRLRWEVKSPVRSITIIDRNVLRHFDMETGKTAVIRADKFPWLQILRDCLANWISADPDQLKTRFELKTKDSRTLRLFPKTTQLKQIFKAVEIRSNIEFSTIESIHIEEISGDRLEIRFVNVRKNPVLPEKLWKVPSS